MLYMVEIRKEQEIQIYNIKNSININIKKLFIFKKNIFPPPPKNSESPHKNFFEKNFDS